jgi:hypothetical protein
LGVLTVEPPVAAPFVPLIWGFLVSDDHLVVSGSCHAVQPMMGCALRLCPIVPRLCPPTGPGFDDYFPLGRRWRRAGAGRGVEA